MFVMMDENARQIIDPIKREMEIRGEVNTAEDLRIQLVNAVEQLLQSDFPRLIQVLYRLDVNEEKLKTELNKHQSIRAADLIADMIIQRQVEKLEMRKRFRGDQEISEEDKW